MKVKQTTNILTRLRSIMSNSAYALHALIVPSSDAHQVKNMVYKLTYILLICRE